MISFRMCLPRMPRPYNIILPAQAVLRLHHAPAGGVQHLGGRGHLQRGGGAAAGGARPGGGRHARHLHQGRPRVQPAHTRVQGHQRPGESKVHTHLICSRNLLEKIKESIRLRHYDAEREFNHSESTSNWDACPQNQSALSIFVN